MPDHYQTLGVEPSASQENIRAAYRRLMQMVHPDHNPGNRQAEAWAKLVNAAYDVLSKPDLRAQYDRNRQPPSPRNRAATPSPQPRLSGPVSRFICTLLKVEFRSSLLTLMI